MRILFTGGRSPATLALLRLFAQAGHLCQVAESQPANLAGASRYCAKNHHLPPPRQETRAFIEALATIIAEEQIELLIPTCEETFYISRYRRDLETTGCQVFTSTIDILTHLHSKYQFNQLLRTLKIPAPATERLTTQAQLQARLPEWDEVVLKPEFSRFASQVLIRPELNRILKNVHPSAQEPWVLQAYLPGPQVCSYSVARQGQLQAHAVYPTVYAAGQGATIYFESIEVPEIRQIVSRLVASLDYTGQISFDFIFSQGRYYPIECNPRTTTGTFLFAAEDNLPTAFLGKPDRPLEPVSRQAVSLTLPMLIYVLLPARPAQAWQILNSMLNARDPLWQLNDFGPYLAQFSLLVQTLKQARKQRVSLLAASTFDIEWNGNWDESTKISE